MLITDRLLLRKFENRDLDPFAALHLDRDVMRDRPAPLSPDESLKKLRAYQSAYDEFGISRWAIEREGAFLGYVGLLPVNPALPLPQGFEIGWRLCRSAWGQGFATEAARAALNDASERLGIEEVLAYTGIANLRSEAVMRRLGMGRRPDLDFIHPNGLTGQVIVYLR